MKHQLSVSLIPARFSHPSTAGALIALIVFAASCASVQWGYYRTGFAVSDSAFLEFLRNVTDEAPVGGNKIGILLNGDAIFASMLTAVGGAQETINMETYIFDEDEIGRRFAQSLIRKAREGVKVRVIVDDLGKDWTPEFAEDMRKNGVDLRVNNPVDWFHILRSNIRTHRKLLIVDGRVGFTGGVGVSRFWMGNADAPDRWRETHARAEGPVVAQLQAMFCESWKRATGEILADPRLFPRLDPVGDVLAAGVGHRVKIGWTNVRDLYLLALGASRRTYYLSSAYFAPDLDCMKAFKEAVDRGVDVRLLVSGPQTDLVWARWLAYKIYGRLLETGVRIFEYQGTNMHAKTLVSDGLFAVVGSSNFDNRAFSYNDESNLVVYDEKIGSEMEKIFLDDLERSREVTYRKWESRPIGRRFLEQAVGVLEGWM